MCLSSVIEVFGFTHMTLLPVFAKDILGVGPVGLGYLSAVRQAGGLLGLMLIANLKDYRRKGLLMFIIAGAFGVGLMAFNLSSDLVYFIVVLAVVNACAMSVYSIYKTLMQSNVPRPAKGAGHGFLGLEHRRRAGGTYRCGRSCHCSGISGRAVGKWSSVAWSQHSGGCEIA
jgi:hypothetical protein